MNVVCFGQSNWDFCWTGKQHLMSGLANRGHRVLYVDPDWAALGRGELDALRALVPLSTGMALRKLAPRLWLYSPTPSPLLPWKLEKVRQRRILRRLVNRLALRDPMVLTMSPRVRHMAFSIEAQARLHFVFDEMTGFEGLDADRQRAVREAEERCLRRSDVAVAVSEVLLQKLRRIQPETRLLMGGADVERFATANDCTLPRHRCLEGLTGPVVGFIGQVDQRVDYPLLEAVARAQPGWNLVLVGRERPCEGSAALQALPNVRLTGYVPFDELPDVLRGVDVAIVPYRRTPLTRSCNPLKVYEYLAAGRPVVATPLDGLTAFGGAVRVAAGTQAFIAAVGEALAKPSEGAALRRSLALASSWERRVDDLEGYLEEARRLARRRKWSPRAMPDVAPVSVAAAPARATGAAASPGAPPGGGG